MAVFRRKISAMKQNPARFQYSYILHEEVTLDHEKSRHHCQSARRSVFFGIGSHTNLMAARLYIQQSRDISMHRTSHVDTRIQSTREFVAAATLRTSLLSSRVENAHEKGQFFSYNSTEYLTSLCRQRSPAKNFLHVYSRRLPPALYFFASLFQASGGH